MTESIFDVPAVLPSDRADALLNGLLAGWRAQAGRDVDVLEDDLEALRIFFDPRTPGRSVRAALERLGPSPTPPPGFEALFLDVGEERHLVTPEGRLMMELFVVADRSDPNIVTFPTDGIRAVNDMLLRTYRRWTRQRTVDVVALLQTETETLRPGAAGLLLVLLVNRNTAEDRALARPVGDAEASRAVEDAIGRPASAWSATFSHRTTSNRPVRLYQGWEISEVKRRLGPLLHADRQRIFIQPDGVDTAIERVCADLRRRPPAFRNRVPEALDALKVAYDRSRPVLAALGLAFEVPSFTAELSGRVRQAAVLEDDAGGR